MRSRARRETTARMGKINFGNFAQDLSDKSTSPDTPHEVCAHKPRNFWTK